MVDNQHQLVTGYRDLSQDEIDIINSIKDAEKTVGALHRELVRLITPFAENSIQPDGRWLSIAKTHFEEGFSAMVRSIAKPESVF